MESLHRLIFSLTPSEAQLVKKFLTCFASREGEGSMQSIKLFEYLLQHKEVPDSDNCCVHVYGTVRDKEKAFLMLKLRLKEKILDLLLTDI
ncbi:MAG TPA: hypothetical protein VII99_04705, partial [Bacteroidia bacterium]